MAMTAGDIDQLRGLALMFRKAVEQCKYDLPCIAFKRFPYGSCADACDLLGRFFEEMGIDGWMCVSGCRDKYTHAWLEKNGLIVDITADQFEDGPGAVIVTSDNSWHREFGIATPRPVGAALATSEIQRQLKETYQMILSRIHIERAEAVIGIKKGLRSMERGEGIPAEEAFERLCRKHGIPRDA